MKQKVTVTKVVCQSFKESQTYRYIATRSNRSYWWKGLPIAKNQLQKQKGKDHRVERSNAN